MVQPQTSCLRGEDCDAAGSWARGPFTRVTSSRAPEEAVVASERQSQKRPRRQPVPPCQSLSDQVNDTPVQTPGGQGTGGAAPSRAPAAAAAADQDKAPEGSPGSPDMSWKLMTWFMRAVDRMISSKTGTLPPTKPVLPPCVLTARFLSWQCLGQARDGVGEPARTRYAARAAEGSAKGSGGKCHVPGRGHGSVRLGAASCALATPGWHAAGHSGSHTPKPREDIQNPPHAGKTLTQAKMLAAGVTDCFCTFSLWFSVSQFFCNKHDSLLI